MGVITWGPRPTWIRTCPAWPVTLECYTPQLLSLREAKALNSENQTLSLCFPKKEKNDFEQPQRGPLLSRDFPRGAIKQSTSSGNTNDAATTAPSCSPMGHNSHAYLREPQGAARALPSAGHLTSAWQSSRL